MFSQFRFFNIKIITVGTPIFNSAAGYTGSRKLLGLQMMGKLLIGTAFCVVTSAAGALALAGCGTGGLQYDLLMEIVDIVNRQNAGDEHRLTVAAGGACMAFFCAVWFYGEVGCTGDMGGGFH